MTERTDPPDVLIAGWRLRLLLVAGLGSLLVSLLAFALSGWQTVRAALGDVHAGQLLAVLALTVLSLLLRFARWQLYLRALGHRLPWLAHFRLYLAGFALTLTPGNAGEAVRTVFLKRRGVPYSHGIAAMFSERLSDLAALLLLAGLGLSQFPQLRPALLAGLALLLLTLLLVSSRRGLRALGQRRAGRIGRALHHTAQMLRQARRCHRLPLLLPALALGLLGWAVEALALWLVVRDLGQTVSLHNALFILAASLLAGGLTVLPGGLGGTEATLAALLVFQGVPAPQAIAATALFRLLTLWFTIGLGLLALRRSRRAGA